MKAVLLFLLNTVLALQSQLFAVEELSPLAWHAAVTTGLNSIAAPKDSQLANNRSAEIGVHVITPWRIWNERYTAWMLRAQTIAYPKAIVIPAPNHALTGDTIKLTNAVRSQLRAELRQVYRWSGVDWALGLGLMLPVTSSISTPRGEFTYSEARTFYPDADSGLRKLDSSYAIFIHLGIEQSLLDELFLLGIGLDMSVLEFPRTDQFGYINFYAGVRIW